MTNPCVAVSSEGVPERPRGWRVLIAVSPPLLGDVLARELARDDLQIVLLSVGGDTRDDDFDLVVTNHRPPSVTTRALLRLPRDGAGAAASLVTSLGTERFDVDEAADLVAIVHGVCGGPRPGNA